MSNVIISIQSTGNKTFVIDNSTYMIPSDGLKGFDYPDVTIYSEPRALNDGSVIGARHCSGRNLSIKFNTKDNSNNEVLRNDILSFFNHIYDYIITVTYMGRTRQITGVLNGFNCPDENIYKPLECEVSFLCPNCWFSDLEESSFNATKVTTIWNWNHIHVLDAPFAPLIDIQYNRAYTGARTIQVVDIGRDLTLHEMSLGGTIIYLDDSFYISTSKKLRIDLNNQKVLTADGQDLSTHILSTSRWKEINPKATRTHFAFTDLNEISSIQIHGKLNYRGI